MRVDAHHHLWRYTPEEYAWINNSMARLRRDFAMFELEAEAVSASVDGTVVVQARQTIEETEWLLQTADQNRLLLGVVGWAPLASAAFPGIIERLAEHRLLKGLRHVVQDEPTGFLEGAAFNRGMYALHGTDLVFDLLIESVQITQAIEFVDRHPGQSFVLDHIGKPKIADGEFKGWRAGIKELARRPNVVCKLSGMVTEADWKAAQGWSADQLYPYFAVALEAFGPGRLMAGTDWPVLTVSCTYSRWWQTIDTWLRPFTATERAAIEGGTAVRIYDLEVGTS